jgi:hypothetical protein
MDVSIQTSLVKSSAGILIGIVMVLFAHNRLAAADRNLVHRDDGDQQEVDNNSTDEVDETNENSHHFHTTANNPKNSPTTPGDDEIREGIHSFTVSHTHPFL